MATKPSRRTRDRILECSLRLFNEFGEPNVTTMLIADELHISPGNLYYHSRNKEDIVNSLFSAFETEMESRLVLSHAAQPNIDAMWKFMHDVFTLIWHYRFFYRDLSDLLSRNRTLEIQFRQILERKLQFAAQLCAGMHTETALDADEIEMLAANMVLVATYWLSYEYVRNPRAYGEQQAQNKALARGCYQALGLIGPYLHSAAQLRFKQLARHYLNESISSVRLNFK